MEMGDRRLQYRVREPYSRSGATQSLTGGLTSGPVTLVARNPKLHVFLDGHLRTLGVGFGDEVSLSIAPSPLRVLGYGGLD